MGLLELLEPIGRNRYCLPRHGQMLVDAQLYLDEVLRRECLDESSLQQLHDAACLPGVHRAVLGMPDIHSGYGLPIGGVMATDAEQGVVSAGAVGMDINCGVRLLNTCLQASALDRNSLERLLSAIVKRVPTGIGTRSPYDELRGELLQSVLAEGSAIVVGKGFGRSEDVERTEENGRLAFANPDALSKSMLKRSEQLGTLGGGNHFIEVSRVERVYDRQLAELLGLREGAATVMIHTGSRGFGHQICTESSASMMQDARRMGMPLPSKGLAALPVGSSGGEAYLQAMACAVNYAFANRQIITYAVREAFAEVFKQGDSRLGLDVVYDVAHNIAKFEEHDGRRLLVHRKGATRALPPGHPGNPRVYTASGHPALLPGSMGSASYVVVGRPGISETFCSVNHGAGRVMSRSAARKSISEQEFRTSMQGVLINAANYRSVIDEAPQAYKDIDRVVDVLADINLVNKVVRLTPLAVIKGEGDE